MTRADLRAICDSLNDEHGTGGQSRLARLLGWHHSTVWRKLVGKSPITKENERAIRDALREWEQQKNPDLRRPGLDGRSGGRQ